jgi:hypothetical protein
MTPSFSGFDCALSVDGLNKKEMMSKPIAER